MDNRPIGMFDSGVGGLTVLKEILKLNPNENIIYFGDTKRFPYGSKSKETIIELTKKGIEFLISKNVKAIVIACGTATSQALEEVKNIYNIPIIGIIEPTVEYLKSKNIERIGVIATTGTIRSRGWENKILDKIPNSKIKNKACPLLAPMAEEGWIYNEIAKLTVKEYLKDIKNIDCLILGCTHYPLFENIIKEELGENVEIINTGVIVSKFLKQKLNEKNMQNDTNNIGKYQLFLSDTETNFVDVAKKLLLDEDIQNNINKVIF